MSGLQRLKWTAYGPQPNDDGPLVWADEAEAHEAAAVEEARAAEREDARVRQAAAVEAAREDAAIGPAPLAEMPEHMWRREGYEQGQRDERQRIRDGVVGLMPATHIYGERLPSEPAWLRRTEVLDVIDAAPQEPTCLHLREMHVGQSGRINDYGRHSSIVECLNCGVLRLDDETVPPDTPTPHPDDHPAAGCVHCQDLAADADDLAREIDREEGR